MFTDFTLSSIAIWSFWANMLFILQYLKHGKIALCNFSTLQFQFHQWLESRTESQHGWCSITAHATKILPILSQQVTFLEEMMNFPEHNCCFGVDSIEAQNKSNSFTVSSCMPRKDSMSCANDPRPLNYPGELHRVQKASFLSPRPLVTWCLLTYEQCDTG